MYFTSISTQLFCFFVVFLLLKLYRCVFFLSFVDFSSFFFFDAQFSLLSNFLWLILLNLVIEKWFFICFMILWYQYCIEYWYCTESLRSVLLHYTGNYNIINPYLSNLLLLYVLVQDLFRIFTFEFESGYDWNRVPVWNGHW